MSAPPQARTARATRKGRGAMTLEEERDKLADMNLHLTDRAGRMERAIRAYLAFYDWHMTAPTADIFEQLPQRREEINAQLRAALISMSAPSSGGRKD